MKIQLISLVEFFNSEDIFKSQIIPFKLAYKYSKLKTEAEKAFTFYRESLQKLLEEYCIKKPDGTFEMLENGSIKIKEGKTEECNKKLNELQTVEIDIDESLLFSPEEFGDLTITSQQIQPLLPFIK